MILIDNNNNKAEKIHTEKKTCNEKIQDWSIQIIKI